MTDPQGFEFSASRQFTAWMNEQRASIALTTYQTGKLFLFGTDEKGQLSVFNLSLIHISEPTRLRRISYAVFCLKKKKK